MTTRTRTALLSLLSVLGVAAGVRAAVVGYEARLASLRAQAAGERKKLGLEKDRVKLFAQYPTPEVSFASGGDLPFGCPGDKIEVKLPGKFAKGTAFVVRSDEVTVVSEKITPTAWQAVLQPRTDIFPGEVQIDVITPVSSASRSAPILRVGCKHVWTMNVATGETLTAITNQPRDGEATVEGKWSRGGKALGSVNLAFNASGASFTFERTPTPEEAAAATEAGQAVMESPRMKAIQARALAAQAKIAACAQGAPDKMAQCMKGPSEEMEKIGKEQAELFTAAQAAGIPALGCGLVRVTATGGVLKGEAERCGKREDRPGVTGTVKALAGN